MINGAYAASPSTPDQVMTPAKPAAASPDKPESALTRAMPANAIRKVMGKPQAVKPMKAPEGKAEIWVYEREIDDRVDRVPVGSEPIIVTTYNGDGKAVPHTVGENIKFADLHRTTVETVELLVFNDRYVTQKVSRREVKRLN